ncbi:MAG: hypothetical protein JXR88_14500 [Clostridia bacterium]|nr:hypothetical protein [Clostridia bacterium]
MQNKTGLLCDKPFFSKAVVKSIYDAVSDDIKMDVINNGLDTNNGTPTRIWDFINRNIGINLPNTNYITKPTKRGRWELKPIYDKTDGIIYTLMREERFEQLKREVSKKSTSHYVQALAHHLNQDIEYDNNQLSLFVKEICQDEEKIMEIVSRINRDLGVSENVVKNHVLVLFSSKKNILVSVRACVIKGDLSIVEEANWNKYIDLDDVHFDAVINIDEVITPEDSLRFKAKATQKLIDKQGLVSKTKSNQGEQKKSN